MRAELQRQDDAGVASGKQAGDCGVRGGQPGLDAGARLHSRRVGGGAAAARARVCDGECGWRVRDGRVLARHPRRAAAARQRRRRPGLSTGRRAVAPGHAHLLSSTCGAPTTSLSRLSSSTIGNTSANTHSNSTSLDAQEAARRHLLRQVRQTKPPAGSGSALLREAGSGSATNNPALSQPAGFNSTSFSGAVSSQPASLPSTVLTSSVAAAATDASAFSSDSMDNDMDNDIDSDQSS
ncbi:hypothetical protein HK100_000465 [Physocladia obscura]|uniref:Uncharacterized protein n=1 Tax=Physocladia obscura TaxID=109957 RepID=A0AAD5T066_9FUNG|nr:hypothetical protein HK100_000465 [Physocladia obscura]